MTESTTSLNEKPDTETSGVAIPSSTTSTDTARTQQNNAVNVSQKISTTTSTSTSTAPNNNNNNTTRTIMATPTRSSSPKLKSPTKFGKANPVRDLLILITFVAGMIWMTKDYGMKEEEVETQETTKTTQTSTAVRTMEKVADGLNNLQSAVASLISQQLLEGGKGKARTEACSVYLAPSSIPGAGLGLFAGKDFELHDLVLPCSPEVLLVPLLTERGGNYFVPPHALLVRHHPWLVNVQGKLVSRDYYYDTSDDPSLYQLRAIKAIPAGAELFVDYDSHPHGAIMRGRGTPLEKSEVVSQLFRTIPTLQDYQLADTLWDDIDSAVRWIRTANDPKSATTLRIDTRILYPTFKRAITRVNPLIGQLLPEKLKKTSPSSIKQRLSENTVALESLQNYTILNLQVRGTCLMEDIAYIKTSAGTTTTSSQSNGDASEQVMAVAGRNIPKGSVITQIPLHAVKNPMSCVVSSDDTTTVCQPLSLQQQQEQTQVDDDGGGGGGENKRLLLPTGAGVGVASCFGHDSSYVLLCPLTHGRWLLQVVRQRTTTTTRAQQQPQTNNRVSGEDKIRMDNIKFQWTDSSAVQKSPDEILHLPAASGHIMWDVVATRNLVQGEELRLNVNPMIALLPDAWKIL